MENETKRMTIAVSVQDDRRMKAFAALYGCRKSDAYALAVKEFLSSKQIPTPEVHGAN